MFIAHHDHDDAYASIDGCVDKLERQLSDMPGVVEHGLFVGMARVALFARGTEIVELRG